MVGGRSYDESPFNLATEGERQPGSSFKAFDLAAALEDGISPDSVWTSKQKEFIVHSPRGPEKFVVHNDEGNYTGSNTLTNATAYSDNSIYAEVGLKVGTTRIAHLAHAMGITTPISTNPAMTIGGLSVGVTPLDMAHAYETIAHAGDRVSGTLTKADAPVGIQEVEASGRPLPDGSRRDTNTVETKRILPSEVAATETSVLETVLQYGTAKAAALDEFAAGKTGTTSNYGDAWFVGWNHKYTVAVWVGYPNKLIPMTSDFDGGPVLGGTFPALIWHDFMTSALQVEKARAEHTAKAKGSASGSGAGTSSTPEAEAGPSSSSSTAATPSPGSTSGPSGKGSEKPAAPSGGGGGGEGATGTPKPEAESKATPAPAAPAQEAPSEPSAPAPSAPAPSSPSPTGGVSPSG